MKDKLYVHVQAVLSKCESRTLFDIKHHIPIYCMHMHTVVSRHKDSSFYFSFSQVADYMQAHSCNRKNACDISSIFHRDNNEIVPSQFSYTPVSMQCKFKPVIALCVHQIIFIVTGHSYLARHNFISIFKL